MDNIWGKISFVKNDSLKRSLGWFVNEKVYSLIKLQISLMYICYINKYSDICILV